MIQGVNLLVKNYVISFLPDNPDNSHPDYRQKRVNSTREPRQMTKLMKMIGGGRWSNKRDTSPLKDAMPHRTKM